MTHDALQPQPSLILFGLLSNVPYLYFRWNTYVKELLAETVKRRRVFKVLRLLPSSSVEPVSQQRAQMKIPISCSERRTNLRRNGHTYHFRIL